MSRNASGIYTLPASAGNPVVAATAIEPDWANQTLADIADALTGSLPRDGSAPMTGALTLSGDAAAVLSAVPKQQLDSKMTAHESAADPHSVYMLASAVVSALAGKQNSDAQLDTLAGITTTQATDLAALSTFIGTLLNDADSATARATLGIVAASATASGIVELATTTEAAAGTDTARAVTPAGLAASEIGRGQTWQIVARTSGVTYTNSTGKPIMVSATTANTTNQALQATVGGVLIQNVAGDTGDRLGASFIVPNGTDYVMTANSGALTVAELR